MARPLRQGIDYFSLDCIPDRKTKTLIRKYGLIGEGIYLNLLKSIYQEGYFLAICDDFIEDFCVEFSIKEDLFNEILDFLIKKGFFSSDLFESKKVLTSHGIQKRFFEATKRRKVNEELLENRVNVNNNLVNVYINPVNVNNNGVNVYKSTQSKVKESKVKKINKQNKKNDSVNAKKKTIEERRKEFGIELKEIWNENYKTEDTDKANKFFSHWTEPSGNGKKFRREGEKYFDMKKRIKTWLDMGAKFESKFSKMEPTKSTVQRVDLGALKRNQDKKQMENN